ncbi:hypothetical protein ACS0TY_010141 [Phlomoides rotata]
MVPELEKMELLDDQIGLKKRKSRDRELLGRMLWVYVLDGFLIWVYVLGQSRVDFTQKSNRKAQKSACSCIV